VALLSLLLAVLVFLAAWEMFGPWEALVALGIGAFEPNLIAHGSIVTTDMAISTTAFGAMYALYRYGRDQTWLRLLVSGVAFGLMFAAKHSAVIFVGIFFVLAIADAIVFRKTETRPMSQIFRRVGASAGIFLIGLGILWSFYAFRYRAIPNEGAPTISAADHIKQEGRPESIESLPAKATVAISQTRIFPESYVLGMADVIAWGSRNTVIFDKNYPNGKWFFFPVIFAVKTNLALVFLLPVGLIFPIFNRDKWREVMFLLVPPIVFFLFASSSNFTNSVRHILAIYGFLIVLASAGAVWLCRKFLALRYALVALLVVNAAAGLRAAPNYLAFANDLWGGYENQHRIFASDTGQSMKLISEYVAREGIQDCWLTDIVHPEMIAFVQPCRPMPSGLRPLVSRNAIDPVPPVIEGTVFVGHRELPPQSGIEYLPISRSEPIAFIGGTTYVYRGRFEIPLAAAISRFHRANAFLRVGDLDQAMAESRQAVELAPDDPRPHLVLGMALIRAQTAEEGRSELELAAALAAKDPTFRNFEVRARQELSRSQ
jgi:hypothetical protein